MTALSFMQGTTKKALCPYGIGDVYITLSDVNPAARWDDTTWELMAEGLFLSSAGESNPAGVVGGKSSHTHLYGIQYGEFYNCIGSTANSLVRALDLTTGTSYLDCNSNAAVQTTLDSGAARNNGLAQLVSGAETLRYRSQGTTSRESNIPPNMAVYMWRRTGGGHFPCSVGGDALCGLKSLVTDIIVRLKRTAYTSRLKTSTPHLIGPERRGILTGRTGSSSGQARIMRRQQSAESLGTPLRRKKCQATSMNQRCNTRRLERQSEATLMGCAPRGLDSMLRIMKLREGHNRTTTCLRTSWSISGLEFHNRKAVMS